MQEGAFVLQCLEDDSIYELVYPGLTTIGRDESNAIVPKVKGESPKGVSKFHAEIELIGDLGLPLRGAHIKDVQSRNGTFTGRGNPLEWTKVGSGGSAPQTKLQTNDLVRFGLSGPFYRFYFKTDAKYKEPELSEEKMPDMKVIDASEVLSMNNNDINFESSIKNNHQYAPPQKNMTISIQYPSASGDAMPQPVSIHIDPFGATRPPWDPAHHEPKTQAQVPSRREHGAKSADEHQDSSMRQSQQSAQQNQLKDSFGSNGLNLSKSKLAEMGFRQDDKTTSKYTEHLIGDDGRSVDRRDDMNNSLFLEPVPGQKIRFGESNNFDFNNNGGINMRSQELKPALKKSSSGDFSGVLGDNKFSDSRFLDNRPTAPDTTKYPVMTFSPPRNISRGRSRYGYGSAILEGNEELETSGVRSPIDGAPQGDLLKDWNPLATLNAEEKKLVEENRGKAAASIRLANKALAGVLDFDDWQRASADSFQIDTDKKTRYALGTQDFPDSTKNRVDHILRAKLNHPTQLDSPVHVAAVNFILDVDAIPSSLVLDRGFSEADQIPDISIPREVIVEALAESLNPFQSTVAGLLNKCIRDLKEVYDEILSTTSVASLIEPAAFGRDSMGLQGPNPERLFQASALYVSNVTDSICKALDSDLIRCIINVATISSSRGEGAGMVTDLFHSRGIQPVGNTSGGLAGTYALDARGHGAGAADKASLASAYRIHHLVLVLPQLQRLLAFQDGQTLQLQGDHQVHKVSAKDINPGQLNLIIAHVLYTVICELQRIYFDLDTLLQRIDAVTNNSAIQASQLSSRVGGAELLSSLNAEMSADGELVLSVNRPRKQVGYSRAEGEDAVACVPKEKEKVIDALRESLWASGVFEDTPAIKHRIMNQYFRKWKHIILDKKEEARTHAHAKKTARRFLLQLTDTSLRLQGQAFRKWEKTIHSMRAEHTALAERREREEMLAAIQGQLRKANQKLAELESVTDVHAALVAERALNRELARANMELHQQLNESQSRALDVADVPQSERRKLLVDLLSVEKDKEIARVRRENASLTEQLHRFLGERPAAAPGGSGSGSGRAGGNMNSSSSSHSNYRSPGGHSGGRASNDAFERGTERNTRNNIPSYSPLPVAEARVLSPDSENDPRNRAQGKADSTYGRFDEDRRGKGHYVGRPVGEDDSSLYKSSWGDAGDFAKTKKETAEPGRPSDRRGKKGSELTTVLKSKKMSKQVAKFVILHEVRRLGRSFLVMKSERDALKAQLAEEAYRNSNQAIALHLLQERLSEKERCVTALHELLQQRLGKPQVEAIFQSLHNIGMGTSIESD